MSHYSTIPLPLTIKHVELNKDLLVAVAWKEIPESLHFIIATANARAKVTHTHVMLIILS